MPRNMFAAVALTVAVGSAADSAQPAPGPSGHWEGAIQIPGQELKIEVDLAHAGEKWEGAVNIPAQGLKAFPLSAIVVTGDKVSFAMKNVPGAPLFIGTLSKDGKTLSGDFSQGGGSVPFSVIRTGDAKIERPPASTPITKELEGSWEGPLDINGKVLRLVLKLANQPNGPATGTLISVDQGGVEIAVASVVQSGMHLKLVVPDVVGTYDGDFKDGQLIGTWSQGPNTWPLTLTRGK